MIIRSQDDMQFYYPSEIGQPPSYSSGIFGPNEMEKPILMSFPLTGSQDDFDDTGAGDNPDQYNDPVPVEDNLTLIFLLGIVYFIWKEGKKKRIFNNINYNKNISHK